MLGNKVLDHFENPRNCGEIQHANGIGYAGKPAKGITTKMSVKVEKGVIEDIKFETAGCALSIASASMVTELVKGATLEKALFLSPADVSQALGGIPEEKMHCSELAVDALYRALKDYCTRSSNTHKNEKAKKVRQ